MKMKLRLGTAVTAMVLTLMCVSQAAALTITARTSGSDNVTDAEFYSLEVTGGAGSISSVMFDITADADAFFDFDGGATFGNATDPVLATLVGITAGDITFDRSDPVGGDNDHPAVLILNFAPGTFSAGDSITFGTDTDFFVSDPAPGSIFANGGALFSATLQGNGSQSVAFVLEGVDSLATIDFDAAAVPEPATATLALLGVAGLMVRRRRAA